MEKSAEKSIKQSWQVKKRSIALINVHAFGAKLGKCKRTNFLDVKLYWN